MVYNWRRTTMKKTILMGIAALVVCGSVNATSWRVCSKPEAGANFLSVAEAVASNNVFAGDTLYVEPGHFELSSVTIEKKLIIIGPGFFFTENNINSMDDNPATFKQVIFNTPNSAMIGCRITGGINISTTGIVIDRCHIQNCSIGFSAGECNNCVIRNSFIRGNFTKDSWSFHSPTDNLMLENNIIIGNINGPIINSTIRNNTITNDKAGGNGNWSELEQYQQQSIITRITESNIYNNIIINTNTSMNITTNENQQTDTFYFRYLTIDYTETSNEIYNNILSSPGKSSFINCIFNANVNNILIWENANSTEEKYMHKSNGPAVGAGVNGTTCGAYGQVNGSRAYQPSGIPQYRPYIYDAQIDETPSSNNTINASFKIKVQQ